METQQQFSHFRRQSTAPSYLFPQSRCALWRGPLEVPFLLQLLKEMQLWRRGGFEANNSEYLLCKSPVSLLTHLTEKLASVYSNLALRYQMPEWGIIIISFPVLFQLS